MESKRLIGGCAGEWDIALEFEPRDLWVGVYWCRNRNQCDIWICIIPCFPIHLNWF